MEPPDPLLPETLAARLWVDLAVRSQGFNALAGIQHAQEALHLSLREEAHRTDDVAAWLSVLGQLAQAPWPEERGAAVVFNPELSDRESDLSWEPWAVCEHPDILGFAVGIGIDHQYDLLDDEDRPTATEAFIGVLRAMALQVGAHPLSTALDTTPKPTQAEMHAVIVQMVAAAEDRAERARQDADAATERASAARWRRTNPATSVTGLSDVQASLVVALAQAVEHYQSKHKGRDPENRDQILAMLSDKGWTKERARKVAGEIMVPDPSGQGTRPLYRTGRPGRLAPQKEQEEVRALVVGAQRMKPLAEQTITSSSTE